MSDKKFHYESWRPPYVYEEVRSKIEADLRTLLVKYIDRPTESRREVDVILGGIQIVLNSWGTLLELSMPDLAKHGTAESTVCSLKFGETELDVEFEFPIEVVQE